MKEVLEASAIPGMKSLGSTLTPTGLQELTDDQKRLLSHWNKTLDIIRDNVNAQVFKTWFTPIRPSKWLGDLVTLQVPTHFYVDWIELHYYDLLQKTISKIFGENTRFEYEIRVNENPAIEDKQLSYTLPALTSQPYGSQGTLKFEAKGQMRGPAAEFDSYLIGKYTFDTFITGESNQLAYSAAKAVADNPGKTRYNPIFIYGDTGLGKSHLVHAIGNYIAANNPRMKVLYTNSERFTMEYVQAIQNNKVSDFVDSYRKIDVLIIDDIQFFEGKEKTQDNFFHTFNALHQAGKQIILTSDRTPKELRGVDERLISRFQWGLTVDIQKPDLETRMAILRKKSAAEGIEFPEEVVEYVAKNVTTSVRELEGCLISFLARLTFDKRPLNLELAREIVGMVAQKAETRELNIHSIKETVSDYYNIDLAVMESKSRKHEIALARQMSMYLAKRLTNMSLKSIGESFGGRDHSTVLHSCQAIDNYLVTDKSVRSSFDRLISRLQTEFNITLLR